MSGAAAARITDPTGHSITSGALGGALGGAGLGAVLGAAAGGVVGAVAGAIAGAAVGALVGALLAAMEGRLVVLGAAKVQIGGLPAARVTDQNACPIPWFGHAMTPLIEGSATTLIEGLFASRVGDHVACGAAVKSGCSSVLIGGPTQKFPDIRIGGDNAYKRQVQQALAEILTVPDGVLWMNRYAATGKTMEIVPYPAADNGLHYPRPFGNSRIEWAPGFRFYGHQADASGNLTGYVDIPPEETLFHEMVHGLHHAEGNTGTGTTPVPSEPGQSTEEAQTIGNGPYSGTSPTENSWRAQKGMSGQRSDHFGTSPGSANPIIPVLK